MKIKRENIEVMKKNREPNLVLLKFLAIASLNIFHGLFIYFLRPKCYLFREITHELRLFWTAKLNQGHNCMYHYKKLCKGATVQYATLLLSLGSDDPTYNPSCSNSISGKAKCGYP